MKCAEKKIISELIEKFPEYIISRLEIAADLIGNEKYDEVDELIDLNKSYEEQLPHRKRVMALELIDYEVAGITWHLINCETDLATLRTRRLFETIPLEEIPNSGLRRILEAYVNYVPKDEFSEEDQKWIVEIYYALNGNES